MAKNNEPHRVRVGFVGFNPCPARGAGAAQRSWSGVGAREGVSIQPAGAGISAILAVLTQTCQASTYWTP